VSLHCAASRKLQHQLTHLVAVLQVGQALRREPPLRCWRHALLLQQRRLAQVAAGRQVATLSTAAHSTGRHSTTQRAM
jgi:hypothetical protein